MRLLCWLESRVNGYLSMSDEFVGITFGLGLCLLAAGLSFLWG